MKTKLALIVFLLVIGGSASAQLVLPICSVNLPCPGFPLGSVQAPIDQNGWRNFKVTLTSNVTSFSFVGIPPSPAQASVNIIFTEDGIGGRTVTFASSITNPCTITTSANTTTLCQFEYDGIAGQWFGISGGGGTPLVVQASAFGLVTDTSVLDATVTNASNIVTCPNSDCHFLTTAAVGQIIQGGTAANGIVLPVTTILSVDSDTQVHTVANATATPTAGTVYLAWGPDNTAALKAAWAASVQICHYLQLPAGTFFIKEALNSQNANCANQNSGKVGGIIGTAGLWIDSKFLMRYDFLYASGGTSGSGCNGGTSGQACFMGVKAADVIALAIDGMWGNNNPASSIYVIENNAGYFDRVGISSLCMGCSHVLGKDWTGTEPIDIRGAVVDVGQIDCNSIGNGVQIYLSPCLAQNPGTGAATFGLFVSGGSIFSKGNYFTGQNGGGAAVDVFGGELHEENDYFTNNSSAIINAGQHWLKHCFYNVNTINNNSGGVMYIEDNDFTGEGAAHLVNASGAAVFDQGGNTYPNSTFITNSGSYWGPTLPPGKSGIVAGNLVLSAGWGTTAAWSALNGAATFSGTITASGTGQAANPTITETFPTAFPVAPRICYALQVGGTQAQGTFAVSSITNTGVVFTYSGTPGAGNTVFVQSLCQN